MIGDELQRVAGIKNILQNNHMTAVNIAGQIFGDHGSAGGIGTLIGRNAHEVHFTGNFDGTDHIRIENDHTLQNTHKDRILIPVFLRQNGAQFLNLCLNLLLGQQNFLNMLFHKYFLRFFFFGLDFLDLDLHCR